jgi:hypothetical protein
MAVQLKPELLQSYFNGQRFHRAYKETVEQYDKLRLHADGCVPDKLIHDRRPSESVETMEYRKKIYVPKTKNPIGKVISSLSKIRRSPDWSVKYDEKSFPPSIVEEETLQAYCEENYPGHGSITNWVFSVFLKNYCIDPNSVVCVLPINPDAAAQNEYYKPIATLYNSPQIIYYEDGAEYAVLRSSERSSLITADENGNYPTLGLVHYVVTTTYFEKYEQQNSGDHVRTQQIFHNFGKLPVFKIRAQFLKQKENTIIQESRLAPMVSDLDEAAREYSDLQAAKVQHMYPLFWLVQSKECMTCKGAGQIATPQGPTNCTACYDQETKQSTGKVKFTPYAHLSVDPPAIGDKSIPMPPAGYVGRDVEIIKHQEESVKNHLFDSLASINMQFLDQTPLNISGEAKKTDREELQNFVYTVAEDIVATMDRAYFFTNEWRYSIILSDANKRKEMLPQIAVPEQFDLLPADYLMDDITKAKTAKVSPLLIATMEEDFAVKKFYNSPELSTQIAICYQLDPLPALSVDEKMSLLSNKGIVQQDYVISAYIVSFVKRAIDEEKDFVNKPMKDQMDIMRKYADEKIKVSDKAEQAKRELLAEQVAQASQQQQDVNNRNAA